MEEVNYKFNCKSCNYNTNRIYRFKRHNLSSKHIYIKNGLSSKNNSLVCACGKQYMRRQCLYTHKKTCSYKKEDIGENTEDDNGENTEKDDIGENTEKDDIGENTDEDIGENTEDDIVENKKDDNTDYKGMFIAILKDNNKIVNLLTEMVPKMGNNNNNNSNNNSNNKFNLNVFLNEKCADAMSMDTFLQGMTVSLDNLMITKDKGFAEGIASIFVDNINKLDIHERPIHCSDLKRDTIYIKNDEKWEKDEGHKKFGKAIGTISYKQVKSIGSWTDEYPDYEKSSSKTDEYIHLVRNCTQCPAENEQKIMKSVSKNILMPK